MSQGLRSKLSKGGLLNLIRNTSLSMSFQLIGKALGFIFAWLAIKQFGSDNWGQLVFALSIMMIVKNIGQYGLHSALIKVVPEFLLHNKIKSIIHIYKCSILFILSFILIITALIWFNRSIILDNFLRESIGLENVLLLILYTAPFAAINVINGHVLQGFKRFGYSSFVIHSLNYLFLTLFIIYSVLINSYSGLALIYLTSYVLSSLVSSFIVYICLRSIKAQRSEVTLDDKISSDFRYLFRIASPLFISSFSFLALNWSDSLILGIYCTDREVGIFNIAVRFSGVIIIGLTAVNTVIAPQFSELWDKQEMKGFKFLAKKSTILSAFLCMPVVLMFLLFPDFFLGLYGVEFATGALSLRVLTIGFVFNVFCGSVGFILMMTNKQKVYRNILLLSVILNITLEFILVPKYNILGAAIANAVGMIVWNVASGIYIYRSFSFWPGFDLVYMKRSMGF